MNSRSIRIRRIMSIINHCSIFFRKYSILLILLLNISLASCSNSEEPVQQETEPTIVSHFGKLQVDGTHIVDQNGDPVILRGMSLFWSQWGPQFFNAECLKWLRDDWKCTVIRAPLVC